MPMTIPGRQALEEISRQSAAFEAKYAHVRQHTDIPKAERDAERERYCILYAAARAEASPVEREIETIDRKTRWMEHDCDRRAELTTMLPAPKTAVDTFLATALAQQAPADPITAQARVNPSLSDKREAA